VCARPQPHNHRRPVAKKLLCLNGIAPGTLEGKTHRIRGARLRRVAGCPRSRHPASERRETCASASRERGQRRALAWAGGAGDVGLGAWLARTLLPPVAWGRSRTLRKLDTRASWRYSVGREEVR